MVKYEIIGDKVEFNLPFSELYKFERITELKDHTDAIEESDMFILKLGGNLRGVVYVHKGSKND